MYERYTRLKISDSVQKDYKERMNLCYVAFIDILGFKDMAENDFDRIILALRKFKTFSVEYFNNVNGVQFIDDDKKDWEKDEIDFFCPKVTMFSDSIVISVNVGSISLGNFIDSLKNLQLDLLINGVTIRGGVELGYIFQDEFMVFGDGLIKAYSLEHDVAIFPRIVIGKKAQEMAIKEYDTEFTQLIDEAMDNHYSEEYQSALYDNYYTSDALGDIVHENGISYINFLINYLECEIDEYFFNTFKQIKQIILNGLKNETENVRNKYVWLKDYYNWIIDVRISNLKKSEKDSILTLLEEIRI